VTRCCHTGIIIFCNQDPIVLLSKRQNTVDTSSFRSECGALNIAVDDWKCLIITRIYLEKKTYTIAYHRVREAAAAHTIHVKKESHETNIAHMLTKPSTGPRLRGLCSCILFWFAKWYHSHMNRLEGTDLR
jgi:hypothetical protein